MSPNEHRDIPCFCFALFDCFCGSRILHWVHVPAFVQLILWPFVCSNVPSDCCVEKELLKVRTGSRKFSLKVTMAVQARGHPGSDQDEVSAVMES